MTHERGGGDNHVFTAFATAVGAVEASSAQHSARASNNNMMSAERFAI